MAIELQSRPQPSPHAPAADGGVVVEKVSRAYRGARGEALPALSDVSLRAARGELVAVVGPSGCGKTTLLELVCRLQSPDSGSIACAPAALMAQSDMLLPWFDAVENAALALRIAGHPRARACERASALFGELGLEGFQRARPSELSGGMRQRVAFLRTLLSGKEVLCLDEPFGALDAITRGEMQQWLARALQREPRTVLLVTHSVEEAVLLADSLVVLSGRPGSVTAELEVDIQRPRSPTDADVLALRQRALRSLALSARAEVASA